MRKPGWPLFIAFVIFSLKAAGQQNYASISFGASLPLEEYAATGDLSANGYARTGGSIKFDAGYFPVSYFGIGGSFSFGSNYAARDSLLKDMTAYVEQNAGSVVEIPDDADIIYGSGFWNYINLFMGPHFSVRATQRLYFDFRGLAGLSVLRPPDQELTILFDGTELYSRVSNQKLALGLSAGTGLRYMLNSNIALKLGVDFNRTRARFDYTFDLFRQVAEEIPIVQSDFPVSTIEFSAGLAYSF
jgi:opacity protein-like surface antigen